MNSDEKHVPCEKVLIFATSYLKRLSESPKT